MNVEFHYYVTAFLAQRAGFSPEDATTLAYSSQYVDHHLRAWRIETERSERVTQPTQSYAFWDPKTSRTVLAPFHFFPAGDEAQTSVRKDGAVSRWDVRPHSQGVKELLVGALRSGNLYRMGLALHTYSDTWAHQNFSALTEPWNHLDDATRLPSPGHAEAGWKPDLWGQTWTDPRLVDETVSNSVRFVDCARKIYRYLCTALGRDFRRDETLVIEELSRRMSRSENAEERMLDFVVDFGWEPYRNDRWIEGVLEPIGSRWEIPSGLEQWKQAGADVLQKAGWSAPLRWKTRPGFERSPLARWLDAAEEHRRWALHWISNHVEDR